MREKHSFSSKCKNLFFKLKNKINTFKNREKKPHPHLDRAVVIMNKYSLVFHLLLSCFLVLVIECISRRNVLHFPLLQDTPLLTFITHLLFLQVYPWSI